MAPRKVYSNIQELGIPSLTTFVHRLANGISRSIVTTTVHMWDSQKKRSKVIARETVGRIENGEPFGRIAFKPDFIERYPILKTVTVMRLTSYEYGYIKAPPPKTLTYESLMLKRGPKFKSPEAEAAAAQRRHRKMTQASGAGAKSEPSLTTIKSNSENKASALKRAKQGAAAPTTKSSKSKSTAKSGVKRSTKSATKSTEQSAKKTSSRAKSKPEL